MTVPEQALFFRRSVEIKSSMLCLRKMPDMSLLPAFVWATIRIAKRSRSTISNTMYDDSYPFLLTDGVTFYFASNEEDRTLGGYDIFVTKYNINTDEYSDPEQLPMPFNSPYNDYMMAMTRSIMWGGLPATAISPKGKSASIFSFTRKRPNFISPRIAPFV